MQKFKNNSSSFWLDDEVNYDVLTGDLIKPGKDYVKMAATKRAIGNFVSIVTGKSIPVTYSTKDESYTDGEQIVISSNIKDKDFDPTVGLALHEGSHCLLTNFEVLKYLMRNPLQAIPATLQDTIKNKYFSHLEESETEWMVTNYITNHVKSLLNYVEDRRIDSFVYRSAPGYQGYYQAMYNKYFNAKVVDKGLQSSELRDLDWKSYMFRIINLTNINRDMDALPGLKSIWKLLDLKNIDKVKDTQEALDMAFKIFEIVESNLPSNDEAKKEEEKEGNTGKGGKNKKGNELPQSQKGQLKKAIQKQMDHNDGDVKKKTLSKSDKKKVQAIQDSGSELVSVGDGLPKNYMTAGTGTKCLVVKNLNMALAESNIYSTFTSQKRYYGVESNQAAIDKGIKLGTMLGRKLQIRNDSNSLTYNRLRKGVLDKRMVASLGYGNEQVFNQIFTDQFSPGFIHISVDASGSMSGDKWLTSQTSAVAIAKAASMVQNLNVVISYRSVEQVGSEELPAIFIAYDSRKDKISKIIKMFKYLDCPGTTPEGLCFEAIQNEIIDGNNGVDSYFINFSDGEPYFESGKISYWGPKAYSHTKKQIDSMRSRGIKILSYFISSGNYTSDSNTKNFKTMYGNDAESIDVTKLNQLTKSLNKKFATK